MSSEWMRDHAFIIRPGEEAICRSAEDSEHSDALDDAVIAIGVFDGFHKGHQHIVNSVIEDAKKADRRSALVTFDKDPDSLFKGDSHIKLMDNESRLRLLRDSGVDSVVVLGFNESLAGMNPEDFLDELFASLTPAKLYVGEDFRFGCKAMGDVETLRNWGQKHGMEVTPLPLMRVSGQPVTSTRIRRLLDLGEVADAASLLGHPYSISGIVVHGAGKGAGMGFQTANIKLPPELKALADGVYAGAASICGETYPVALSCGVSPTFEGERDANIEAHILDYEGDLYGKRIDIDVLEYLRPMIKFHDVDELIAAVKADIATTRRIVAEA